MSQPFVCNACRLKLALRTRVARIPGKRTLSRASSIGQEYRHHEPYETRRPPVHHAPNEHDSLSGRSQASTAPRGRYSGALRPQQLLEQLEEPTPSRPKRHDNPQRRDSDKRKDHGVKRLRDFRPSDVDTSSPPRWGQAQFLSQVEPLVSSINENRLHDAWRILQVYSNGAELEEKRRLSEHGMFFVLEKKLGQLMRRLDLAWMKSLQGESTEEVLKVKTSPANELENLYLGREKEVETMPKAVVPLPTPYEFAQVAKKLGWFTRALRVEMLWRLGKGVMAAKLRPKYALQPGAMDEMLDQIVVLWHDAFHSHLRGSDVSTPAHAKVDLFDWSFLPPVELMMDVRKGTDLDLEDILAVLVPVSAAGQPNSPAIADYQSALMISFDVLQSNGGDESTSAAIRNGEEMLKTTQKPLTAYFESILRHATKLTVPAAIKSKLELGEDPTLAYYEALVRRLNLQDIPPIRTARGRIAGNEHKPSVALDELGRPLNKSKDRDEALPAAVEESEILEDAKSSDEPTVALSKEGLRDAGFTLVEGWSMDADVHIKVDKWIKRLGRAAESTNLDIAQHCWNEVQGFNTAESGAASLPLYLYEHFMLAFLAVRQPKLAIEVWNKVIEAGLEPTIRTWTVMMRGCARAKDSDTMEAFWRRMHDQGVKPDQHAWSVRIMCLIESGRVQDGLAAVNRMGQEWMAAVKKKYAPASRDAKRKERAAATATTINYTQYTTDIDSIPRPTTAVMNTAISSLASKADASIPSILAWGRSFNLTPDLTTYNTLLNVSMRHSQTPEALALLSRMRAANILPDSTTFTVLLTALFQSSFLDALDPGTQTSELLALIEKIESTTPDNRLDSKAYALAIDRMLKTYANPAAARALLTHMSSRGIEPTTHIYTILMTSYFASDPPDFPAAQALWNRIQHLNDGYGAKLDTIFYDRMVESYGLHHRSVGLAPSLMFLERMSREGKRPGWRALEMVARAMADRGEWGRLAGLVRDLRDGVGWLKLGVRGKMGQDEFWRFVLGTGVMQHLGEGEISKKGIRRQVGSSSFHGVVGGV